MKTKISLPLLSLILFLSSCQSENKNSFDQLKTTSFVEIEKRVMAAGDKLGVMAEMKDEWFKLEFKIDKISEKFDDFENWGGYLYSSDFLIDDRQLEIYYPKLPKEALNVINKKMKSGEKVIIYGQVKDLIILSEMDSWILEIESTSDLLLQHNIE